MHNGQTNWILEYKRADAKAEAPHERIRHFKEFHTLLPAVEQQLQGGRCMECGIPFCQSGALLGGMNSGCPLRNLVPEINDLIYQGNWKQAYKRLTKTHSFPEFTCTVCPALCEAACTCGLDSDPVSIRENERAVIETAFANGWVKAESPKVRTGKKIAVIGSGPSGLAAAQQLNRRGHQVTVFERQDRAGGLLRYGIPNMKLDKSVIDRRIRLMEEEGVIFCTNTDVGKDIPPAKLQKEFDRILLCCGASNPRDIKVPGRDGNHIYFAVDYLTSVTKSLLNSDPTDNITATARDKHVLVIGGGDTGNDCVATVLRLGAKSVTQLEIMPKAPDSRTPDHPWPQWPCTSKTGYGQEEAIALFGRDPRIYQTTVTEFINDKKGNVQKAKIIKLAPKTDEKTGRLNMIPVKGTEETLPAQLVLIAAGFLGCEKYITDAFDLPLSPASTVSTLPGRYETSVKGIFTAGDMHRGQSLVVWAIREGRKAAEAVDLSLMGYTNL